MKMATWRQLIRAASDRIADRDRQIERQWRLIEELANGDHDTGLAEHKLNVLVEDNELLRETRQRSQQQAWVAA
jgi:hypothetical protein